ncbi:MAG: molybdopterin/thiamine biosynthesis adenylyltransferase [Gammaproteobacteria bacterium]|jgi:molybdopterin/thiamine biosynthesis adenylyltransferase
MSSDIEFSRDELIRYSRQLRLKNVGINGQQKLRDAHVVIIGMGGLGCPAASYLAASGVGTLSVVDHDHIEASNLQRQLLYRDADIGQSKAETAARELRLINPHIKVVSYPVKQKEVIAVIRSADVVLDCCDNFDSRYQTNALCREAGVALVSGAAIRMEGQLVSFAFNHAKTPCYNCLFPETDNAPADSCDSAGILPPVVGQIGAAQALEAIKLITASASEESSDKNVKLQLFDATTFTWRSLNVASDPSCNVCSQQQ